jgi:drug/metabolite transporter (DMT)-like permease
MSRRGVVLFASMCVIWGIPYLLIKVAVDELSPVMLVLARTAIAALLLLPIAAARRELRPLLPFWLPILAFAAIEMALPWFLIAEAERTISSSLTALLIAGVPLVGAVIARTSGDRERLGPQNLAGLLLGVLGVAAIVGLDFESTSLGSVAEIGVVAVCYAVGPVILQRWLSGLPALGVIAASLGLTAVVFAPLAAVVPGSGSPSADAVAAVVALALICTALAFLVFFALIAEIGPVRATVITYVNPAVAAVLGVVVLDESLTAGMGVGFALVLAGSVLATRPSGSGRRPPLAAGDPARESA